MVGRCVLEVHAGGVWQPAAEVRVEDTSAGPRSPSRLEYELDYVDAPALVVETLERRIARVAALLRRVR